MRKGRKEEFKDFGFDEEPPDAQDENTYLQSKINWQKKSMGRHAIILNWHRTLIQLRSEHPSLKNFSKEGLAVEAIGQEGLVLHRKSADGDRRLICLFNFSEQEMIYDTRHEKANGEKILDSKEAVWMLENENKPNAHPQVFSGGELMVLPLTVVLYELK